MLLFWQPERMAVLFTNRATCEAQIGQPFNVIKDCTTAIAFLDSPKPRLRRALAHEVREKEHFRLGFRKSEKKSVAQRIHLNTLLHHDVEEAIPKSLFRKR